MRSSPAEVVRTARYATIKDQALRREWERFQQRINIQGELIPLDPAGSPMSDAAWALENLARAKMACAGRWWSRRKWDLVSSSAQDARW
jgi:hypothetical protein